MNKIFKVVAFTMGFWQNCKASMANEHMLKMQGYIQSQKIMEQNKIDKEQCDFIAEHLDFLGWERIKERHFSGSQKSSPSLTSQDYNQSNQTGDAAGRSISPTEQILSPVGAAAAQVSVNVSAKK